MLFKTRQVTDEILTPRQFLDLSKEEKSNIIESKIIPPQLGKKEYGKFKVTYKDPIYAIR